MQIKAHNVVLDRRRLMWCTRWFCLFIINSDRDGAQYTVVGLSVCMGLWELHCAPPHRYRTMVRTTKLCCAPQMWMLRWCTRTRTLSIVMDLIYSIVIWWFITYIQIKGHNVVFTGVHFGGAQCRFFLIRWCTRQFWMFIMDHHLDCAQCDVVSLDVAVCVSAWKCSRWTIKHTMHTATELVQGLTLMSRNCNPGGTRNLPFCMKDVLSCGQINILTTLEHWPQSFFM